VKRNTESASLQAIPSRAAEIPISKGPHSPLKLCAFVRVSDAGDGGWGGVRGLQVNPLFLELIFIGTS
jgi:hypothetical protein